MHNLTMNNPVSQTYFSFGSVGQEKKPIMESSRSDILRTINSDALSHPHPYVTTSHFVAPQYVNPGPSTPRTGFLPPHIIHPSYPIKSPLTSPSLTYKLPAPPESPKELPGTPTFPLTEVPHIYGPAAKMPEMRFPTSYGKVQYNAELALYSPQVVPHSPKQSRHGVEVRTKRRVYWRPPNLQIQERVTSLEQKTTQVSIYQAESRSAPPFPTTTQIPSPPGSAPSQKSTSKHFPQHFTKGSFIRLANGQLKPVEDLRTEDFIKSADMSTELQIDSSTVVRVEEDGYGLAILHFSVGKHHTPVKVEAAMEHPFFVFGQGWSSCVPTRTLDVYGLASQLLKVGDVCVSLTLKNDSPEESTRPKMSKMEPSTRDSESHRPPPLPTTTATPHSKPGSTPSPRDSPRTLHASGWSPLAMTSPAPLVMKPQHRRKRKGSEDV